MGNSFFQENSLQHLLLRITMSRTCVWRYSECSVVLREESQCPVRENVNEGKHPVSQECAAINSVTEKGTRAGSRRVDWHPTGGKVLEKRPPRQAFVWPSSARVTYNLSSTLGYLLIKGELLIIMLGHWVKTKTSQANEILWSPYFYANLLFL